ncbi:MAG: hypothetical protein HOQ02_10490 [Lysobacter sp.]|nr:hypothetical protein [Lysobacter sp.]
MGRFARSWALAKASLDVLKSDKELLVFPLVSAVALVLVAASFVLPAFGLGLFARAGGDHGVPPAFVAWMFAFYLAQYFVMFFFNAALVGAAMMRLDGGDPTVRDGLRIAGRKWLPILGYAAIAATVGMVLRAIEERAGIIGRIVAGMIGVAWTLATFLTVPLLVARDVGPLEAVTESAALLKRTWGENLIGKGGIGMVFGLLMFAVLALGGLGAFVAASNGWMVLLVADLVLAGLAVLGLALVQAALSGIYSAALYRYATEGNAPAGFDGVLLRDAFQRKV